MGTKAQLTKTNGIIIYEQTSGTAVKKWDFKLKTFLNNRMKRLGKPMDNKVKKSKLLKIFSLGIWTIDSC